MQHSGDTKRKEKGFWINSKIIIRIEKEKGVSNVITGTIVF